MTPHIIELGIEIVTLLALYFFSRGFDERITVLEDKSKHPLFTVNTTPSIIVKEPSFKSKIKAEEKRMKKSVKK